MSTEIDETAAAVAEQRQFALAQRVLESKGWSLRRTGCGSYFAASKARTRHLPDAVDLAAFVTELKKGSR